MTSTYGPAYATPAPAGADVGWLLHQFAQETPGLTHAIIVSLDGLQLATSEAVDRDLGDQLAAATSGLLSLANQCGSLLSLGSTDHVTVRLKQGHLLCMRIGNSAGLIVAARLDADLRVLAHRMTAFVTSADHVLVPQMRQPTRPTD